MNQNTTAPKEPKTLTTLDGNTLMAQTYEPIRFSVEKILPHGLFILAGSPKIGKSWLSLDLCQAVSTGGKLWDFQAEQGDVLYLALEDTYNRLQNRLKQMSGRGANSAPLLDHAAGDAEKLDISRLHMATASYGLQDGLLEQVQNFLAEHPGTNLIVVDTLEHIRNGELDKSMYSYDYNDMKRLRQITDKHKLTLLLVHHTRKMFDADPLNTISGSTGLVGTTDGVFVLEKAKRTGTDGKLTIANRDTESFCFDLMFDSDKCRWAFIGNSVDSNDDEDTLFILIDDFLQDEWGGTSTELCKELTKQDSTFNLSPATLTKRLKSSGGLFRKEFNIAIDFERKHSKKLITLKRVSS